MTATTVITTWLLKTVFNFAVEKEFLNNGLMALTPLERLYALRRLDTGFMDKQWFVITGIGAIVVLSVLYIYVSYNRKLREQNITSKIFNENAERCGLSQHERQILFLTARLGGLSNPESIFSRSDAFDRGAEKMIENSLSQHGSEQSNQLRIELTYLRENLGFPKKTASNIGALNKSGTASSRQIPIDKSIYITRRKTTDHVGEMEAKVIANTDLQLILKLSIAVDTAPGDIWRARYYLGTSVWEFDSSVIDRDGDVLILNHSFNVRFVNRRRFLRVGVSKPAYITKYPFSENVKLNQNPPKDKGNDQWIQWGTPEFVKGVLTELAGPGLLIETPLDLKTNDRVLVMFRLDDDNPRQTTDSSKTAAYAHILRDIGMVKHTNKIENGWAVAIELTGMSDSDMNLLIRATNDESIKQMNQVNDTATTAIDDLVSVAAAHTGDQKWIR